MTKKYSIRNVIAARMLEAALKEAPVSADSIVFFARNLGADIGVDLSYDENGLVSVESIYRRLCNEDRFTTSLDRASFEHLMMYFLGQTLVIQQEAEWVAYKGRDYVVRPLLVKFNDTGKGLDLAAVCYDLINSPRLIGANTGQALLRYYTKAKKIGLIVV